MKLYTIGFLLLFFSLCTSGQSITKSDLRYTEWCVDNSNKNFYKSDTIHLYRFLDTLTEIQKWNIQYRELDYNNGKDIAKIKFKKKGRAEITDHNIEDWTASKRDGKWRWKYDDATQKLTLLFEKELKLLFKIVGNFEDRLVWKYEDTKHFPKEDIYHIRVLKLIRIN